MRWLAAVFGSCSVAAALVVACTGGSGAPTNPLSGDASSLPLADGASPSPGPVEAGPPDERILPLTVGHQWTFDVKPADGGTQPATCVGTQTQSVSAVGHVEDAGPTVVYHPLCYTVPTGVEIAGDGDRLIAYVLNDAGVVQGQPLLFLDAPVEEGHQWIYSGGISFVWHDAGMQTVPAGTFSQCWERTEVGKPPQGDSIIYCRGVGQVRLVNSTFQAELTSKNF